MLSTLYATAAQFAAHPIGEIAIVTGATLLAANVAARFIFPANQYRS